MLSAMTLKAAYLAGKSVSKKTYLQLYQHAEEHYRGGEPGEMSPFSQAMLPTFPLTRWREQRLANIATSAALRDLLQVRVMPSTFGIVLRCESHALREHIRTELIAANVFPAILWDLTGNDVPRSHAQLSRHILFLHADFRWTISDMDRATSVVRAACGSFTGEDGRC
jgi:hypothetical protein